MSYNVLSSQVSVSGQIQEADVETLAQHDVEIIVCNRPDNEDPGQPDFALIANKAKDLNIEFHNIPFSGGEMTNEQVAEFKQLLSTGKRIHAYCRSGNRSSIIWKAASEA
jgi:uncharacterized protein (TIGR01244 family)